MIAIDTNILVYAHSVQLPLHAQAVKLLEQLAVGEDAWGLPWPCVYEFVRVVTHPNLFRPPSELERTILDLEALFRSPSIVLLGDGPAHPAAFRTAVLGGGARGNLAYDAHIAALLIEHGVTEFWTADRDFTRFPGLRVRNPFAR